MPLSPSTLVYDFSPAADPQISPDGGKLLYTVTQIKVGAKPHSEIWTADVDGNNARQLTHAASASSSPRWSPDGRQIAFVSSRGEGSAIFMMESDLPGDPREVIRHRTPISSLAWSPDGTKLAYLVSVDPANPDGADRPSDPPPVRVTRRIDYKQDDRGFLDDIRLQVFIVDVATGERRQLTHRAADHFWPAWSPDGRWVAAQVPNRNEMASQLMVVPAAGGDERLVGPEVGFVSTFAWSLDSRQIAYCGDTSQSWQSDIFVYDVASAETRRVTDDLPIQPDGGFRTLVPPSPPVWLDDRRLLLSATHAGASGLYEFDLETGRLDIVHLWNAVTVGLCPDASRRRFALAYSSLERTGELAIFDHDQGATVITNLSGAVLKENPPAQHQRIEIERAGLKIEGWLLLPPDFDPVRRYPVVLDVHGGPNSQYGPGFNAIQQLLATNGFLVVFVNPRGSTSYGRDFTQRVTRDWGGEDYLDLMAALDLVLERPYADRDRTGIWGYSYGGYMTAWAIGQSDRFKAAVCGAPCFDLRSAYGTSDIGHSFGDLQWGGIPADFDAWYAERSPSNFIHRAVTPTLIVHGEADERCPIGQGEQMFVGLKKAGCEVEFVRYPNCSHVFLRNGPPAYREDLYRRILDWFQWYLGPEA